TLRRALAPSGDAVVYQDRSVHLVSWAKRFLFRPEQLDLPVSRLSGGEQARLLIAQLVNFLILFFLLKKLLYKPVLDLLERRRVLIAEGLRDAERSKERLAGIEGERKQVFEQAEGERRRVLESASLEAEQLHHQRLQAAANEAEAVIMRAKEEAERLRQELLAEVRREVGDLVLRISRKVTKEKLSKAVHAELVAGAIEELTEAKL
ncbi:MAG: F0F1 ATP synthase subunit B, partial [bacterium]|nr:F0F1 ATP synthase subunit B [bacterium]